MSESESRRGGPQHHWSLDCMGIARDGYSLLERTAPGIQIPMDASP